MCTVISIPTKKGMFFCSVRDENSGRKEAIFPIFFNENEKVLLCPVDSEKGGTWIGLTSKAQLVILLNGAFENHLPNNRTYIKSRGLIVSEMIQSDAPFETWKELDLRNIEPFTLIVFHNSVRKHFTWNGETKFETTLKPDEVRIWSSSTLYNKEAKTVREDAFNSWISGVKTENIPVFDLLHSLSDKENGFLIDRSNNIKSLSVSIVNFEEENASFTYHDLQKETMVEQKIALI